MTEVHDPLLAAVGLRKAFGRTEALRGVSMTLAPGEVLAVTGPSGSGKSTLLLCLAGVLRPEAGHVQYAGQRLDDLSESRRTRLRRRELGLVLQFGQLVPELTGLQNVMMPLLLDRHDRAAARTLSLGWLERLGAGQVADVVPGEMSGGEAQPVAVARALVAGPRVVFADEPTGALDTLSGERVLEALLSSARDTGAAVVLVTHDNRVAATADREIVLREGALVVVAVGAVGVLVGLATSGRVVVSPLGLVRRQPGRPPRPWGALLLLAAAATAPLALVMPWDSQVSGLVVVGLAVFGMVALAPWAALSAGRLVERRARSVPVLLAARRLVAEPRPAGRAAAALGGIALVAGGSASLTADLISMRDADSFYFTSMALVGVGLFVALLPVVGSLAVYSAESLLEHRRSVASLSALGATRADIVGSQRWEAGMTSLPVATIGVLLGAGALLPPAAVTPLGWLVVLGTVIATPLLVWLSLCVAVLVTRPFVVRAADPANLRTG